MKIINLFIAVTLLMVSTMAQSAIIRYGNYSHDDTTDIVVGDGLEWLQWGRTVGMSYLDAQTARHTIEGGGWRIASNAQVASLFYDFDFGGIFGAERNWADWEDDRGRLSVRVNSESSGSILPPQSLHTSFIRLFGYTQADADSGHVGGVTVFETTAAWVGEDANADGLITLADVTDLVEIMRPNFDTYLYSKFASLEPGNSIGRARAFVGVALVRPSGDVPEPSVMLLMASGLIAFGVVKRKARK